MRPPVGSPHPRIRPVAVDRPHRAIAREPPDEQVREVRVPPFARLAAEERRVDRDARAASGGDLRPTGTVRVPRLHADQLRERREQVVPRVDRPARRCRIDEPNRLADEGLVHRDPSELGHVTSARVVVGGVEPVRIGKVRVGQAELPCTCVHEGDEAGDRAAADERGDRIGSVVRTLDQRRPNQIAHGHALAATKVDRRLADRGRARGDGRDVVERCMLERDDRRHQLRDRGHRQTLARVVRCQHLAGAGVLNEVRLRVDRWRRCGRDDGEGEHRRESQEEGDPLHGGADST